MAHTAPAARLTSAYLPSNAHSHASNTTPPSIIAVDEMVAIADNYVHAKYKGCDEEGCRVFCVRVEARGVLKSASCRPTRPMIWTRK